MLVTWIGIFAVSVLAEVVTTCYYRALAADGPGRRRWAMLWSGACRVIGLLLLKHVISAEGAAGLLAGTAFVAGDVAGTWIALWHEDRDTGREPEQPEAVVAKPAERELRALVEARIELAVSERLEAAVRAAVREEADRREEALVQWRAPVAAPRRVAGVAYPRALVHRSPQSE